MCYDYLYVKPHIELVFMFLELAFMSPPPFFFIDTSFHMETVHK